jgi:hypothetical protein
MTKEKAMTESGLECIRAEIVRGEETLVALGVKRDAAHAVWGRAQLSLQHGDGKVDLVLAAAGVYYYWRRQAEDVRVGIEHNLIVYAGLSGLLPKGEGG